jgi:uncharacterized protein
VTEPAAPAPNEHHPETSASPPSPGVTARTRIRRLPAHAATDRAALLAVLDAGKVAHVGVTVDGQPFVLPVAYGRRDDAVLFHGSTGSRLFRALAAGAPCCFTVTLLDGLVLARSAFESSMHYRSAVVLGVAHAVDDKAPALRAISERLMPGRWADIREPSPKELAATLVLALPLDEWSVKINDDPPDDGPDDVALPIWAGVVPVHTTFGVPVPAPDIAPGLDPPSYVDGWTVSEKPPGWTVPGRAPRR